MAQLTIQQAFDLALQHHSAGRLHEAEQLYRQILAKQPTHVGALHYLGVLAHQQGRNDVAVDLIRKAIDLNPNLPEPHNNLGLAFKEIGRLDDAVAAYRQALTLRPSYPSAFFNLGIALQSKGQLDDAIVAYRDAIALQPYNAKVHINLGNALRDKGNLGEAIAAFRKAIAFEPNLPEVHNNLGNVLYDNGQMDEAIAAYRLAISIKPDFSEAHYNLGNALRIRGQVDEAISAYLKAIALRPDHAGAHNNLGDVLRNSGELDQAVAAFRRAVAIKPQDANAHFNLGNAMRDKGQLDEAIAAYQQVIALRSDHADAYNNLGHVFKDRGQLDAAIAAYRQAIAIAPADAEAHSNLVYALYFHPAYTPQAIAEEQRLWNQRHAAPLRQARDTMWWRAIKPHSKNSGSVLSDSLDPHRRLRIGYVSPDFRNHVIGRNLLPLLEQHDHSQFEITCYAQVSRPDGTTHRIQRRADRWRNIVGLSDEQTASHVLDDRIDILVDLTLHMAHNRLLVFARKPAPVQVTFAGYPASTGLTAIDYRLSDPYLDPPGNDESVYSEQTIRLPDSFWCYDPLGCQDIPVSPLPAAMLGTLTFGCLNNFCKINLGVLSLWARVLRQVPGSRLLMLTHEGTHRQQTLDHLGQYGIDSARIEFASRRPHRAYLDLYNRIDIGLDTFPYNGHTTSLDSLWMGVPVVTLPGQTPVSRAGWSQLFNLGLTDLAAHTADQFVSIAVQLAVDLPKLKAIRASLRQRMEQSSLMDAPKFARGIEAAYRQMWRTWCETSPVCND